ncbi:hypothetical protein [Paraburkholderia steynii]|uniref:hypothetical protein n=1 Tax=Paraburkholderia steynii TaxID=1245441 RepID=UPI0014236B2F|nr:hypothetical protein [Paraburkholderia steynii]
MNGKHRNADASEKPKKNQTGYQRKSQSKPPGIADKKAPKPIFKERSWQRPQSRITLQKP